MLGAFPLCLPMSPLWTGSLTLSRFRWPSPCGWLLLPSPLPEGHGGHIPIIPKRVLCGEPPNVGALVPVQEALRPPWPGAHGGVESGSGRSHYARCTNYRPVPGASHTVSAFPDILCDWWLAPGDVGRAHPVPADVASCTCMH